MEEQIMVTFKYSKKSDNNETNVNSVSDRYKPSEPVQKSCPASFVTLWHTAPAGIVCDRDALMDLQRLILICKANVRLIVRYIEDISIKPIFQQWRGPPKADYHL